LPIPGVVRYALCIVFLRRLFVKSRFKQPALSALAAIGLCVAFVLGTLTAAPTHSVYGQSKDIETELIDLYKQVNPSVVSIQVRIPNSASSDLVPQDTPHAGVTPPPFSAGDATGFIYNTDGYIVTNSHVVQDADRVEVTFADDTTLTAKVIGMDRDSDLAVIKVETDKSRLIPATLADSDKVQVGQRVGALGNPFGYNNSLSQGIISGLNRRLDSQAVSNEIPYQIPGMIQTDAAINPGNSGGPLFDMNGAVVGINTLIESRVRQSSGVGFAVPSNLIKKFASLLIKDGKIDHSFLGIQGGDLNADEATLIGIDPNQRGVLVTKVTKGSPADKGGIKPSNAQKMLDGIPLDVGGDIIVAVDKMPIHHFEDLLSYLFSKTDIGQTITVTVLRDGKQVDLQVTLEARPH